MTRTLKYRTLAGGGVILIVAVCATLLLSACENPAGNNNSNNSNNDNENNGRSLTGTVSIGGLIDGYAIEGEELTANTASLEGSGAVSYRWNRSDAFDAAGTAIDGETGPEYTLTAGDKGKYITVTVTREDNTGNVTSGAVGYVRGEDETWYITFDKNGGDTEANPKVKIATSPDYEVNRFPVPPTKPGYVTVSWNIKAEGDGDTFHGTTNIAMNYPDTKRITVYAQWEEGSLDLPITNINLVPAYLAMQQNKGERFDDPVYLEMNINLENMLAGSNWQSLINKLEEEKKYVELDLSACGMTGTDFVNRSGTVSTMYESNFIVELILPDVARTIIGGNSERRDRTNGPFTKFNQLRKITGEEITGFSATSGFQYSHLACVPLLEEARFPKLTSLGNGGAFQACPNLKTVYIPQVASICSSAFFDCPQLTSVGTTADVIMATGITILDGSAFGRSGITEIDMSSWTITTISGSATAAGASPTISTGSYGPFSNCTSLKKVIFPSNGNVTIGRYAFQGCTVLKELVFNGTGTVTALHAGAFANNSSLEEIDMSNWGIANIGGGYGNDTNGAFLNCTSLKKVTFPSGLVTIERGTFAGCTALNEVIFNNHPKDITFTATGNGTGLPDTLITLAQNETTGGPGTYKLVSGTWVKQ